MDITDIFKDYGNKICQIQLYQRDVKDLWKRESRRLVEYAQRLEGKPNLKEVSKSLHAFHFRDLRTGNHLGLDQREMSIDEQRLSLVLHTNKQYQWLLAEAYEAFEDFLDYAYAYAASVDNDFWPLGDYGSASLSQLKAKTFDWYLERARAKRSRPQSIINQIREKRPRIVELELKNALDVNFKIVLPLIENLRHVIVHCGGRVSDKTGFVKGVLEAAGLYNNGNPKEDHLSFIYHFFGNQEYANTVLLLEHFISHGLPIELEITSSRFNNLCDCLTGYAFFVGECLVNPPSEPKPE